MMNLRAESNADQIAADAAFFSIIRCRNPLSTAVVMVGRMAGLMREAMGPRQAAAMLREMATLLDREQQ